MKPHEGMSVDPVQVPADLKEPAMDAGQPPTMRQPAAEMRDYIRDRYAGRDEAPGWYERGGVIPNDPGPYGDGVPALLHGGCDYVLTSAQLERLAAAARKPARLLAPLPWRTRTRLAGKRAVNRVGIWLVNHGH